MLKMLFSHLLVYGMMGLLCQVWMIWSLKKNQNLNRKKSSVFECGFDTFNSARLSFSVRFFFLLLLFLMFDVELTMLLQFPLLQDESMIKSFYTLLFFLVLLILGLQEEWRRGFLKWI